LPEPARQQDFRQVPVRWGLSAHARRLLTLAVTGLVLALLTGRPEFIGVAAPALILLVAWREDRPAYLRLRIGLAEQRTVEGHGSDVLVDVAGQGDFEIELLLVPAEKVLAGPAVTITGRACPAAGPDVGGQDTAGQDADQRAGTGERVSRVLLPFTTEHWGYRPVGYLTVVLRDRFRLTEGTIQLNLPWADCRPDPAQMRSSVVLSKLPSRLGEHPARAVGEGIEFAGVRQFVPGDRQRRVNWPATTRLGTLHLNTFAAERTQNVVVIADATADVGPDGTTTLDLVLRGAAGVITRYLTARDRVGLIVFGSRLTWIGPGQGRRHQQRLLDLLVASPAGWDRAKGLTRLPRSALPPGALVLVFSPLLDTRVVEAVRDMRERGFGVLVVDVLSTRPRHDRSRLSGLAGRMWQLEQDAVRYSMKELGVPVVHWDGTAGLDEPLSPFSRRAMVVHR
jgi:uncharacterized protein (DUF58 family)